MNDPIIVIKMPASQFKNLQYFLTQVVFPPQNPGDCRGMLFEYDEVMKYIGRGKEDIPAQPKNTEGG